MLHFTLPVSVKLNNFTLKDLNDKTAHLILYAGGHMLLCLHGYYIV